MALTNDQITAQNFKDFYNHIMPYLNGQPALNYSTDEQVVGTWIDGKPLYQKTIVGQAGNNTGYNYYSIGASVDEVISQEWQIASNDSHATYWSTGNVNDAKDTFWKGYVNTNSASSNPNTVYALRTSASGTNPFHVTIRYTKTTD